MAYYSIQTVSACDSFLIHSPHDLSQAALNLIHVHCSPGAANAFHMNTHTFMKVYYYNPKKSCNLPL